MAVLLKVTDEEKLSFRKKINNMFFVSSFIWIVETCVALLIDENFTICDYEIKLFIYILIFGNSIFFVFGFLHFIQREMFLKRLIIYYNFAFFSYSLFLLIYGAYLYKNFFVNNRNCQFYIYLEKCWIICYSIFFGFITLIIIIFSLLEILFCFVNKLTQCCFQIFQGRSHNFKISGIRVKEKNSSKPGIAFLNRLIKIFITFKKQDFQIHSTSISELDKKKILYAL